MSFVIPTSHFVDSLNPWKLFTFGSIVVDDQRVGSKSILATLGTLPLRFLSLVGLIAWILRYSFGPDPDWEPFISSELNGIVFVHNAIYLAVSAYLTFRSPRKVVLPALGLLLNLHGFFAFLLFLNYTRTHSPKGWMISVICATFLIAWVLFLISRLAAPTNEVKPLTILAAASTGPNNLRVKEAK